MPDAAATLHVWNTAWCEDGGWLGQALQEYEVVAENGRVLERRELPLRFAVIDRSTFEAEAATAGFKVLHLWGDYSRGRFESERSPYMIWELGASP